jgi:predicted SnoaL-like aldol condensation-catalyzing enzyme
LISNAPDTLRYEHQLIIADIVRIENGRLADHWDVLQDEATKAESKSGRPMFGDRFTA